MYILYQLKTGAEAPHCMSCHVYDLFLELLYLLRSPASHAPSSREQQGDLSSVAIIRYISLTSPSTID